MISYSSSLWWLLCIPFACLFTCFTISAVDGWSRSLASRERVLKNSVSMAGHSTALSSVALRQKGG